MRELMRTMQVETGENKNIGRFTFERQIIEIPFDISSESNKLILEHIQNLESEVKHLKSQRMIPLRPITSLSEEQAKQVILSYIKDVKKIGIKHLNIIDLIRNVPIPAEQIEKVMDSLKTIGVKEL